MPFDPYADFRPRRRLGRAVRVMVLACIAAVGGVIAGGAGVFAVVGVLTTPPPHRANGKSAATASIVTDASRLVAPVPPQNVAPTPPAPMPAAPPKIVPPNSRPDAATRGPQHVAAPPKEVVTTQVAPAGNEQKAAKAANNEKELRAADTRPAAATENRVTKPLYGYVPQPYGEAAKRRGETAARDRQPSAWDRLDARDHADRRATTDPQIRGGFFGRDAPGQRDWSRNGMREGFADDADGMPPRGYGPPPRDVDQRRLSDRDQPYSRNTNQRRRPGYDLRGDDQFDSLIGNDEWVGDWHH